MQNQLMQFFYDEHPEPVRVELIDGNIWLAANDACKFLEIKNSRDAIQKLDDDEVRVSELATPSGIQKANFVNESGFYCLAFKSLKPAAKKFRKWVTNEVLPQIRKTGSYGGRNYKRTECYTKNGYVAKGFYTNFIDYRTCLHGFIDIHGHECKTLEYNGEPWVSIANFLRVLRNNTTAVQWSRHLNSKQPTAKLFWCFGETTPSWFTNANGLHLIKLGARKITHEAAKVEIPFACTLPKELPATN